MSSGREFISLNPEMLGELEGGTFVQVGVRTEYIKNELDYLSKLPLVHHPIPTLTMSGVTTHYIWKGVNEFAQSSPDAFEAVGIGEAWRYNEFKYIRHRELIPEMEEALARNAPALIVEANEQTVALQKTASIMLENQNLPINIDMSILLWQADPELWKTVVQDPFSMYFRALKESMASARLRANEFERKSIWKDDPRRIAWDGRKSQIAAKILHEAAVLGCPEVVYLSDANDPRLSTITVVLTHNDKTHYISDMSHVFTSEVRKEIDEWETAKEEQRDKLEAAGIADPLFELNMPDF